MKTVTIYDPEEVSEWLNQQLPSFFKHRVQYGKLGYSSSYWFPSLDYVDAFADSPEELLAKLRQKVADHDETLERLKKEADALNYKLVKKP